MASRHPQPLPQPPPHPQPLPNPNPAVNPNLPHPPPHPLPQPYPLPNSNPAVNPFPLQPPPHPPPQPQPIPRSNPAVNPNLPQPSPCPLCTSHFASSHDLRTHINACHPNASGLAPILPPLHPPVSANTPTLPSFPPLRTQSFAPVGQAHPWFPFPPMPPFPPQRLPFPSPHSPFISLPFAPARGAPITAPAPKSPLDCEVCDVKCDSKPQIESHLLGQKHRRKLFVHTAFEKARLAFDRHRIMQIGLTAWTCTLCKVDMLGKTQVLQHLDKAKHKRHIAVGGPSASGKLKPQVKHPSTYVPHNAVTAAMPHPLSTDIARPPLQATVAAPPPTASTLFPIATPPQYGAPLPPFAATRTTRASTAAAKAIASPRTNAPPHHPTPHFSSPPNHSPTTALQVTAIASPVPNHASASTNIAITPSSTAPPTARPTVPPTAPAPSLAPAAEISKTDAGLIKGAPPASADATIATVKPSDTADSPSIKRARASPRHLEYLPPMKRSRPGVGTRTRVDRLGENHLLGSLPSPPRKKRPPMTSSLGVIRSVPLPTHGKPNAVATPVQQPKQATLSPVAVVRQTPLKHSLPEHPGPSMPQPSLANMPNPNFRGPSFIIPSIAQAKRTASGNVLREYPCTLCQVICNSEESLHVHLASARHWRRQASQDEGTNPKGKTDVKPAKVGRDVSFSCDVCGISCCGKENFQSHLRGKLHAKRQKAKSSEGKASSQ